MGSEIILLLLAGVGGCHGSGECCASLCVWRSYFFANPLGVEFSHKFHPNTPCFVASANPSCVPSFAAQMKPQHPDSDLNTPHFWRGVDAVTGGVFAIWYISTERNSWTRKNPSRWNSKIFPRINTYLVTHLHRVSYARMINRVTISLSVLRTVVCLLAFECSTDGHTWRIIRRTDTHTVHELFDGQTIL